MRHDNRLRVRRVLRPARRLCAELVTTLHAVLVLIAVETVIRWVPLPRLCNLLGLRLSLAPASATAAPMRGDELPSRARRQLRCTRRIADVWPLSKGPCLRRSLVAGHLLRRHDPAVRLGVAGAGDTILAHAWLESDGRPLEDVARFDAFQRPAIEARR